MVQKEQKLPREMDVHQFQEFAKQEPVFLLDVRQPWEFDLVSLPQSTLIPLNQLQERIGELQVDEGTCIVTVCHHGVRSLTAAAILERLGFPNVVSLAGGIDAWSMFMDPTLPRY